MSLCRFQLAVAVTVALALTPTGSVQAKPPGAADAQGRRASPSARPGSSQAQSRPQGRAGPTAGPADPEEELKMFGRYPRPGRTWTTVGGEVYGARPDERGPLGGGAGYKGVVTGGDFRVRTLEALLAALKRAKAGQVVFVDGKAEIDCTTRVYIEQLVIEVPAGVTLASDRGHGGSFGAMLLSDAFATRPLIRAAGRQVRLTGMRIRGPDPKRRAAHHRRSFSEGRGHKYYYRFPISNGIATGHDGLEVDNCELAGFSHAAIYLRAGKDHRIHHNYIHHNQYKGLGYGVCHGKAFSQITHNLFNWNRHSIAGTGRPPSGYEAAHNVELGHSLSHCFDMHGGGDRKDGTNMAGTTIRVHHNTFRAPNTSVKIRGVPQDTCEVFRNWFVMHKGPKDAVVAQEKTVVRDNVYGAEPAHVIP